MSLPTPSRVLMIDDRAPRWILVVSRAVQPSPAGMLLADTPPARLSTDGSSLLISACGTVWWLPQGPPQRRAAAIRALRVDRRGVRAVARASSPGALAMRITRNGQALPRRALVQTTGGHASSAIGRLRTGWHRVNSPWITAGATALTSGAADVSLHVRRGNCSRSASSNPARARSSRSIAAAGLWAGEPMWLVLRRLHRQQEGLPRHLLEGLITGPCLEWCALNAATAVATSGARFRAHPLQTESGGHSHRWWLISRPPETVSLACRAITAAFAGPARRGSPPLRPRAR